MNLLTIKQLHAGAEGKKILKGLDLTVNSGEVHAIMGPNGSGKSTLAMVLAGREGYDVESGTVTFRGKNLLEMDPEDRSREGLFLAFQYPIEIHGVSLTNFMKTAVNEHRKYKNLEPLDSMDFLKLIKDKAAMVGLEPDFVKRFVNQGFSGGEKKRNEIFQMAVLEPTLAVLDETDSGLDIDALRTVSDGVNRMRSKDKSFIVITHYQRLLNYIQPDYVHVLYDGRLVKSGGKELALELEKKGYDWIRAAEAAL